MVGNYKAGKWNGTWVDYNSANGKINSKGKYRNNSKQGKWMTWDMYGILNKVEIFDDGKLIKEITFK